MTDIGPQRVGDARGWLQFDSLSADLARAEDQTQYADHQHIREDVLLPYIFIRSATDTERTLLAHLGYELPDSLNTTVEWVSFGVRNRRWPQLENGS
jgi:hypothetical protein